jgi:hypothetical protein
VKRPILGLLAAATLSLGVVGTAPAQAAAPASLSAPASTPAHGDDDRRDDHRFTRQHGHGDRDHHRGRHRDHDGDRDHHRRQRRCEGHLVAICLL